MEQFIVKKEDILINSLRENLTKYSKNNIKTFLSKVGKSPVLIRSELLPPNTTTGDTEFDKTYPFWCLAVTILSSEIERIVAVDNATLVSSANLDNVLQKCYNWFTRINTTNLKIIEGRHDDGTSDPKVIVGDKITCETEYLGEVTGRIIRQTFGLAGGITVKDSVLK